MSKNHQNLVLDIIVDLVKAVQSAKGAVVEDHLNGEPISLGSPGYLLGQTVRQYVVSDRKRHISKAARALWDQISSNNIWDYSYAKFVSCENEEPVADIPFYKGNAKTPYAVRTIKKGDKIRFNDVFHDEHIIDISTIINMLLELDDVSYENVKCILDQMHIARILKSEDKMLARSYHRGADFDSVLAMYQNAGIELLDKEARIEEGSA